MDRWCGWAVRCGYSGGSGEAEVIKKLVESIVYGGVQAIESRAVLVRKVGVVRDGLHCGGEWRVDAVEQLEEQDTHAQAVRGQVIGMSLWHLQHQAFGAQFGQVVA